ncbi:MAG: DUF3786 domain-containing protein [Promethearchaeota archaeon]
MKIDKSKLVTVQQIDGMATKTPHARELEGITRWLLEFLPQVQGDDMKKIIASIGGTIDDLEFGEDFTITFEYFPEVRMHLIYYGPDDEDDGLGSEPEVKFLFSGSRVTWVSSEDLASLVDLTMDFIRDLALKGGSGDEQRVGNSDLLERSIQQRMESFKYIEKGDLGDLAEFVGGTISKSDDSWTITREFFTGINVSLESGITLAGDGCVSARFSGDAMMKINNYAKDQLAIFLMNHVLRFIATKYPGIELPEMVDKAFSFSYLKGKR